MQRPLRRLAFLTFAGSVLVGAFGCGARDDTSVRPLPAPREPLQVPVSVRGDVVFSAAAVFVSDGVAGVTQYALNPDGTLGSSQTVPLPKIGTQGPGAMTFGPDDGLYAVTPFGTKMYFYLPVPGGWKYVSQLGSIYHSSSLAVDGKAYIYANGYPQGSPAQVLVYPPGAKGYVPPIVVLPGDGAFCCRIDVWAEQLYVSGNTLRVYSHPWSRPLLKRTILPSNSPNFGGPVAVDKSSELYVADGSTILAYSPTASGKAKPDRTISVTGSPAIGTIARIAVVGQTLYVYGSEAGGNGVIWVLDAAQGAQKPRQIVTGIGSAPKTLAVGPLTPTPTPSPPPNATVVLEVDPSPKASPQRMHPHYVSPGTTEAVITITPAGSDSFKVAIPCTPSNCTTPFAAPIGQDSFTIKTYNNPHGNGLTAAVGQASLNVVAGQTNVLPVTLNPVVVSAGLATPTLQRGQPRRTFISVPALDADHFTIYPPGNFLDRTQTPVTFTLTKTEMGIGSHDPIRFSPSTFTAPTSIMLVYDGGRITYLAFTLKSSSSYVSVPSGPVDVPIASPSPTPSPSPRPTPTPTSTPSTLPTPTPSATATPKSPTALYFAGAVFSGPIGIEVWNNGSLVRTFDTCPNSFTIPIGVALDSAQTLYVGCDNGVLEYANGQPPPVRQIAQGISGGGDIVTDQRTLYLAVSNTIQVYAAGATSPTRVITKGIAGPNSLAVDKSGNLYVSNGSANDVTVYARGGSSPIRTIRYGMNGPGGLAFDSKGTLYVLNRSINAVMEYANGGRIVTRTVTNGINSPLIIALGPDDTLHVINNVSCFPTITAYRVGTTTVAWTDSFGRTCAFYNSYIDDIVLDQLDTMYVAGLTVHGSEYALLQFFPNGGNGTGAGSLPTNWSLDGPMIMGPP